MLKLKIANKFGSKFVLPVKGKIGQHKQFLSSVDILTFACCGNLHTLLPTSTFFDFLIIQVEKVENKM